MSDKETGRRSFIKATGALGVGAGVALTSGTAVAAATPSDVGPDAFDNFLTPFILNAGGLVFWNYFFNNGDRHVQIAGPNIMPPFNGSRLNFFDFGKAIEPSGIVRYFVSIRNVGGSAVVHNLEGGGVT